jgi:hypothetical protein
MAKFPSFFRPSNHKKKSKIQQRRQIIQEMSYGGNSVVEFPRYAGGSRA